MDVQNAPPISYGTPNRHKLIVPIHFMGLTFRISRSCEVRITFENSSLLGKSPDKKPFFFFSAGTVSLYIVLSMYLSFCSAQSIFGGSSVLSLVQSVRRGRRGELQEQKFERNRGPFSRVKLQRTQGKRVSFDGVESLPRTACRFDGLSSPLSLYISPPDTNTNVQVTLHE